jgi:hypothetical protein
VNVPATERRVPPALPADNCFAKAHRIDEPSTSNDFAMVSSSARQTDRAVRQKSMAARQDSQQHAFMQDQGGMS